MGKNDPKYKPSKMVNWFEPGMLFQTGLRSVVSGTFGNYADRRETEAALSPMTQEEWNNYKEDYASRDEIWMDYISDTGDGFYSTFSVARLAAEESLTTMYKDKAYTLPRGKLLFLGGDQVYPTPADGLYRQKFNIPFEAAFPEVDTDNDRPDMYAIPGNHDWYDGLSGFLKTFCQQRRIGNWQTRQHRSYFARPLPHNYWVWATDIQLAEDIDKPQLDYFLNVATNQMEKGDKVILLTAEPAWIYRKINRGDKTYNRFRFFIEHYITEFTIDGVKQEYEIAAVLTGDLHHYSHYCTNDSKLEADHYFGAGGGGAFLHLTHNLPESLDEVKPGLTLQARYPDKNESLKLLMGNLGFFFKNWYFSVLLGIIYLLFFWLLRSAAINRTSHAAFFWILKTCFGNYLCKTADVLSVAPFLSILSAVIILGFWKFTDTLTVKIPRPKPTGSGEGGKNDGERAQASSIPAQILGFIHGIIQCFSIYTLIWLLSSLWISHNIFLYAAALFVAGGIWGGFIMGLYLLISNLVFQNHGDESSSSLACENYKCFLRLHIKKDELTVYPIGIKRITKSWQITQKEGDHISVTGPLPEVHLIEGPITIKSNQKI